MKIYIATTNAGKIKEITAAFIDTNVELIPLEADFDELENKLKEDGIRDMLKISQAKAKEAIKYIQEKNLERFPVIVDDAGIYFEKMQDAPGIETKAFVKNQGGINGVKKLIQEGDGAYFQSIISYMDESFNEPKSFVGKLEGRLSPADNEQEIEKGLPFNHIFIPVGYNKFLYQIPLEERAKFSHRFKAVEQLKECIGELNKEFKIKMR